MKNTNKNDSRYNLRDGSFFKRHRPPVDMYILYDHFTKKVSYYPTQAAIVEYNEEISQTDVQNSLMGYSNIVKKRWGIDYNCKVVWQGREFNNIFELAEFLEVKRSDVRYIVDFQCEWAADLVKKSQEDNTIGKEAIQIKELENEIKDQTFLNDLYNIVYAKSF